MSEIPIFTLAIATYISTNDHLERAGVRGWVLGNRDFGDFSRLLPQKILI